MISLLALSLFWTIVCAIVAASVLVPLLVMGGIFSIAVFVGILAAAGRKRRDALYRRNYPFNRS